MISDPFPVNNDDENFSKILKIVYTQFELFEWSIFSRFEITAWLNHGRCCVMQINILFSLRKIASEKWMTIYLYRCITEYILIKIFHIDSTQGRNIEMI